jgi:hypothetical protein
MQSKVRGVTGLLLPSDGTVLASASQDSHAVRAFGDLNVQHL